ncbi:dephospho-CoA kinase [Candidatus Saganbacteria bacterium]|nr:dephospho-CoA kinase [Candidatus Saganbacteria bacterium]
MSAVKIIGLTGPIAAGKDTVAKILQRRGAIVIDADKIAHAIYIPQSMVWQKLVAAFGSRILERGGIINRRKLADIVFADPVKRQRLNAIAHPYLKTAILELIKKSKEEAPAASLIVVNAALLQEIGLLDDVSEVWLVRATLANRLRRLLKKGVKKKKAWQRIKAQPGQKKYLDLADVVIDNNSSPKNLTNRVAKLF